MQKKEETIYIIGIGGISLSALARFLKKDGFDVLGSDICDSEILKNLRDDGFEITIGDNPNYVYRADMIVYTSAVSNNNSDICLAKKLGKPIFSRAEVLGIRRHRFDLGAKEILFDQVIFLVKKF